MLKKMNSRRGGFTLVELMIVVAIIALLAAIAIPSAIRARKRSQATTTLATIRLIDAAKEQYAIESGKTSGATVDAADLQKYVKANSKLYNDLKDSKKAFDALGNEITWGNVDAPAVLNTTSKTTFEEVVGTGDDWKNFWNGLL
jgi:prepilin-type N-terminal cleavage/methylation domain-containing protein